MTDISNLSSLAEPGSALRVDLDCLVDKLGNNYKQIAHLVEIFKAEVPKSVAIIKTGIENRESKEAKNSCHGLRGMLLTMEMCRAAEIATWLESLIVEKDFDRASKILPLLSVEMDFAADCIEKSIAGRG